MTTISIFNAPPDRSAPVLALLRTVQNGWTIFQLVRRQAALSDKLFDLSDAELAKRGLKREEIPQLVADIAM